MTLTNLLIFSAASLLIGLFLYQKQARNWLLLVGSVLALYWLQPSTPIRNLDFWLPTATLALTVFAWAATRPPETEQLRTDWITGVVLLATVLGVALMRSLPVQLTPTRPPQTYQVLIGLVVIATLGTVLARLRNLKTGLIWCLFALILALFVVLKTEPLALAASRGLRNLTGQSTDLATVFDIRWLGFSYVAFRLLHTLRDRLTGRLPELGLREFVTYTIFFPAFTAGPIDRVQRFVDNLEAEFRLDAGRFTSAATRIVVGVFKKFALADSLALIALNAANAQQSTSTLWTWVLLYAYAFRIYFDFSGYTDIAIGIGQLVGITLPENFERPYLKTNLTAFWNAWHITLAQWFRAYFFNPLTRTLRKHKFSVPAIILVGQLGTMVLIGLWHGATWNFAIWGAWHGLGLFLHNRWADFAKVHFTNRSPAMQRAASVAGALLTFHFVALGWVWFALPTPALAVDVFQKLFGL
ncbi:MAG: MBOAT family protein [Anaerolineales bacterium]|nr:MBOAT family protein [Anaerolineales bacterium]